MRSTERLTRLHRDTILDLVVLVGQRCDRLFDEKIQGIEAKRVQADEIWGFVEKKEKRKKPTDGDKVGDAYTFVGIEAQTKLILCFELGRRDYACTGRFIKKLERATSGRFQLTTDGFVPYIGAIEDTFGADIDFAQLIKV